MYALIMTWLVAQSVSSLAVDGFASLEACTLAGQVVVSSPWGMMQNNVHFVCVAKGDQPESKQATASGSESKVSAPSSGSQAATPSTAGSRGPGSTGSR